MTKGLVIQHLFSDRHTDARQAGRSVVPPQHDRTIPPHSERSLAKETVCSSLPAGATQSGMRLAASRVTDGMLAWHACGQNHRTHAATSQYDTRPALL